MSFLKSKTVLSILVLFTFFSIIHYSMGYHFKPFYVIAITGLMVYLNQYRKLYIAIILFYSFIACLYFPVGVLYGPPDYNIFSSFYYTNTEEAKGFITNINLKYYILSVLILVFGILICQLKLNTKKITNIISLSIFVIITIIQPVKAVYNNSIKLVLTSGLPEIRFFTESLYYLDYLAKEKNLSKEMILLAMLVQTIRMILMLSLLVKAFAVTLCIIMVSQSTILLLWIALTVYFLITIFLPLVLQISRYREVFQYIPKCPIILLH